MSFSTGSLFIFTENVEWHSEWNWRQYGKLFLSLFRIFAVGAIGYYLYSVIKRGVSNIVIILYPWFLQVPWEILSIVRFMVFCFQIAMGMLPPSCQRKEDMLGFSMAEWLICYTSPCLMEGFPSGYRLWEGIISLFSAPYSILPIQPLL